MVRGNSKKLRSCSSLFILLHVSPIADPQGGGQEGKTPPLSRRKVGIKRFSGNYQLRLQNTMYIL